MQEEDIAAVSVERLVEEIFRDIGDVFCREKLSLQESNIILVVLEETIKKEIRKRSGKEVI